MASTEFKVEGLDELKKRLDRLPDNLERNVLRGAIRAACKPIVNEAKARVPVLGAVFDVSSGRFVSSRRVALLDSRRIAGALKRSIRARSVQRKNGMLTGGVTAGGSNKSSGKGDTFYARFVEFGTIKMPAHPFLRPAIDHQTRDATDEFAAYIRERLSEFIFL